MCLRPSIRLMQSSNSPAPTGSITFCSVRGRIPCCAICSAVYRPKWPRKRRVRSRLFDRLALGTPAARHRQTKHPKARNICRLEHDPEKHPPPGLDPGYRFAAFAKPASAREGRSDKIMLHQNLRASIDSTRRDCALSSACDRAPIPAGRVAAQCDINAGTGMDCRILRVTPPSMNSRSREWP